MNVWIVQRTYPSHCIIGVYSSLEKAKESLKDTSCVMDVDGVWVKCPKDASRTYTIIPYEVK